MSKTRARFFAAAFVALSVMLVGTAFATEFEPILPPIPNPGSFDPQLNVTPSDALTDGQVVSVDGVNFGGNQTGVLRQCTEDRSKCSATTTQFTTGRNGNFGPFDNPTTPTDPASVPVNFTVRAAFLAEGTGTPVSCVPSSCIVDAISFQVGEIRRACHHITFAIVDTTPCTQPTSATTSTTSTSTTSSTSTTTPTTTPPTSTTTTSTSTTTSSTSTSTSTTQPGGTTTSTLGGDRCASLRAIRAQFNAQIDQLAAAITQQSTGSTRAALLAKLEQSRAAGNASIDQALQTCASQSA